MKRSTPRATRGMTLLTIVAMLLLATACTHSESPVSNTQDAGQSGPTSAQLAALRTAPAPRPITGPRVPELVSLADAQRLAALKDVKIVAQTG